MCLDSRVTGIHFAFGYKNSLLNIKYYILGWRINVMWLNTTLCLYWVLNNKGPIFIPVYF